MAECMCLQESCGKRLEERPGADQRSLLKDIEYLFWDARLLPVLKDGRIMGTQAGTGGRSGVPSQVTKTANRMLRRGI